MYTDNYGNSTKYIYMYMIVLDYIHTQRYWTQNKRVRVWRTNTNEEEEEENKGQGKDGYIPRWHAVKSMYTGSGGMLRSRFRPGQTWHQWGQDRKILWQKDLLSQTKKTINLRNKKSEEPNKKLKHHGNSINTFKKLPFTTSDNYWYLWKLSIAVTKLIMDMHTLHVDLSFFNVSCEIFLELSG